MSKQIVKCECRGWQEGMQIINGIFINAFLHGMEYNGKIFSFCPWCGKKLKLELIDDTQKPQISEHPDILLPSDIGFSLSGISKNEIKCDCESGWCPIHENGTFGNTAQQCTAGNGWCPIHGNDCPVKAATCFPTIQLMRKHERFLMY